MLLLRRVLRQASQSSQEVAVCDLALDNIRWVDTVEDEGLAALICKVVGGASPVKLLLLDVRPELVTLVLLAVDEEGLGSVRERWIVPGNASSNDVLVRQGSKPRLRVREGRSILPISELLLLLVRQQRIAISYGVAFTFIFAFAFLLSVNFLINVFFVLILDHSRLISLFYFDYNAFVRWTLKEK